MNYLKRRRNIICLPIVLILYFFSFVFNEVHIKDYIYASTSQWNSLWSPEEYTRDELMEIIRRHNDDQVIYNEDIYGPVLNDTIIIVIQVHDRVSYLRHAMQSLSRARHVNATLLIFSHDVYDDEINGLVRSINFTKVMQMFYPYSLQLYPDVFPGRELDDCPRYYNQVIGERCKNRTNHRTAHLSQIKHHWWWKANRVFRQLECTAHHNGMVMFLEDDHYVTEDVIHMLQLFRSAADAQCPTCEILCFGTPTTYFKFVNTTNKAVITSWHTKVHNIGFALNRTVWDSILSMEDVFCTYDEYNWDLTMLHISALRKEGPFKVLLSKGPRVFHIGRCGVHYTKRDCEVSGFVRKIEKMLYKARHRLYPETLDIITKDKPTKKKRIVGFYGWADVRDHELCRNITKFTRRK